MRRPDLMLALTLACSAWAVTTHAARGAAVTGTVVDADGNPVPAVRVSLRPTKGDDVDLGTTDGKGAYAAPNVPDGDYQLIVERPFVVIIPLPPVTVTVNKKDLQRDPVMVRDATKKDGKDKSIGAKVAEAGKELPASRKRVAYAALLFSLAEANQDPQAKREFVAGIGGADPAAVELNPTLKGYAAAGSEELGRAIEAFGKVFSPADEVPKKSLFTEDLKLNEAVLKDIMVYQFRTKGSKPQNEHILGVLKGRDDWKGLAPDVERRLAAIDKRSSLSNPK